MAAKKNREYWIDRKTIQDQKAQANENKLLGELYKEYEKASKEIQSKITLFYAKYGKNDIIEYHQLIRTLSKNDLDLLYKDFESFTDKYPEYSKLLPVRKKAYQLTRLEALEVDIMKSLVELGYAEEEKMKKFLRKQYRMGYMQTMRDIEDVFGVTSGFNTYNRGALNYLLKNKWMDGKNYSDRIWDSKGSLVNYLSKEFKTGVARGISIDNLSKQVIERFGKSRYSAERLVRTESNYILNAAEMDAYKDDGIEEYEYLAAMDSRTSDICKGLHKKRFKVKDYKPGVNAPPMHPFCRSTTVPVIKD